MNLQTRKLNIIECLIQPKGEKSLSKIELTIVEMQNESKLLPYIKKQLLDRAKQ
jgi:hypothetical protein